MFVSIVLLPSISPVFFFFFANWIEVNFISRTVRCGLYTSKAPAVCFGCSQLPANWNRPVQAPSHVHALSSQPHPARGERTHLFGLGIWLEHWPLPFKEYSCVCLYLFEFSCVCGWDVAKSDWRLLFGLICRTGSGQNEGYYSSSPSSSASTIVISSSTDPLCPSPTATAVAQRWRT